MRRVASFVPQDDLLTPCLTVEESLREAVLFKTNKYSPEKYPVATLVPFAVEALGRPSEPALQLFRDLAPTESSERAAAR